MDQKRFSGCRVLVVDDELLIALDLSQALEEEGCAIAGPASSVAQALGIVDAEELDAAFLDENLAGTPVTPVAEALALKGVPFTLVTGYTSPRTGDKVIADAPRLPKPTTSSAIVAALGEMYSPVR